MSTSSDRRLTRASERLRRSLRGFNRDRMLRRQFASYRRYPHLARRQAAPSHPSPLKPRPLRRSMPRQPARKLNHSPRGDTKSSSPSRRTLTRRLRRVQDLLRHRVPERGSGGYLRSRVDSAARNAREGEDSSHRTSAHGRNRLKGTRVMFPLTCGGRSGLVTPDGVDLKGPPADVTRPAFSNSTTWCRTHLEALRQSRTWSFAAPRTTGTRPNNISGCSFVRFSLCGTPSRHERKTS